MVTRLYSHPIYLEHLTPSGHPERPDRLRAIERVLEDEKFAALDRLKAPEGDPATILYVHPESFVEKVRQAIPEEGIVSVDADTSVSPKSWQAALTAIGAANAAVDDVFSGRADNVFVASRPPGHHAEKTTAMGFCLFNNAAIAARHAQKAHGASRVAIVDWDVHHGNGTQDIYYDNPSVMFLSVHRYGHGFYPGTGAADETGSGRALGFTKNVPVRFGTPRRDYLTLFKNAVSDAADRMKPELVLLSAGFDAHTRDPIGSLGLETEDFTELTRFVLDVATTHSQGRLVSCLEGGYHLEALAESVETHVATLLHHL